MNNLIIREERIEDYKATELMVRRAFWNIHGPGCNEHLIVHKLRMSEDFLSDISRAYYPFLGNGSARKTKRKIC